MIQWQAPEFEYHRKSTTWFVTVIGLTAILIIVSLWQKNLLFTIFIALAGIMMIVWGKEKPRKINFKLDNHGIWIGSKSHYFDQFNAFAIRPGSFCLKYKARLKPYLTVVFPEERHQEIKSHLLALLPEIGYDESIVETLMDFLGF